MSQSNLSVCYEGIQRVYRNAMVRHIRRCFIRDFPSDYVERLHKPFKREEWDGIVKNAEASRSTGEVTSEIKDDFDLLSVNHFFNVFEAFFDNLVTLDGTKASNKSKIKQTLLQWLKTVKSFRDPLSHPSEEDFSFEDSFLVLDCARRSLELLKLEGVQEIRDQMEELRGRPLYVQAEGKVLEARLPARESIVVDFVGRGTEIDRLWEWFSDPVSRRFALAGEGGKGKTACAYNFATQVQFKAPQPYQVVLWVSAKLKKFQEGAIVPIESPDFTDLDSALNKILLEYGWADDIAESTEKKKDRVIELLNSFPALLIVDDIDTLEAEAEDATEFFSLYIPQTKSKVLFTSRRVLLGMGNSTLHIKGLSKQDAEQFITSRCDLMELDRKLLLPHVNPIIDTTEGSPLFMEDLLRLCSVLPVKEAVKAWEQKKGDVARQYALGREFEILSPGARELLVAACYKTGPTSYLELQSVTGMSEESMTEGLLHLQRLFLIPKPSLIEGEQRYNVNYNTRTLVRKVYSNTELWRRIEAANKAIAGEIPRSTKRGNIAPIIRRAMLLSRNGQPEEAEKVLLDALRQFPNDPDLTSFLGGVYKSFDPPRLTDAREKYHRAWQLKCANENSYRHWVQMELDSHEWTKAFDAAEKGMQILGETRRLLYLAGHARGRYARELLSRAQRVEAQVQIGTARKQLEKALVLPSQLQDRNERALNDDVYRAVVLNCETANDVDGLKEYFDRWLKEHPDSTDAKSEWYRLSAKYRFG